MQPNQPTFSDAEIDQHLENLKPHLREAFRKVCGMQSPLWQFPLGQIRLTTGENWDVQVFVAAEPLARMIQGMIMGYGEANKAFLKQIPKQAPATPGNSQPAAPSAQNANPFAV